MPVDARLAFYKATVSRLIPDRGSSILVVAGGPPDKAVFEELGFRRVVISNLDTRTPPDAFAPFAWRHEDAEALSYADGAFDYVVVHAALHHCQSPHRALLEMYRVARIAAVAFEARDSLLMRAFERLGLAQVYEHSAVYYNDGRHGGVRNTEVPNYVYRWTEREVEKTIKTYAPHAPHRFEYFYGHDTPATVRLERGTSLRQHLITAMVPAYGLFSALFPKQQNLFAFVVHKPRLPEQLHAWLQWEGGQPRFNLGWAERRYRAR
jgi:SAM-dependent methyltransferase